MKIASVVLLFLMIDCQVTQAQLGTQQKSYNRADTLRGSITAPRAWWDVVRYDLDVTINYMDSSIQGSNVITYKVLKASHQMQIDLMHPLTVDSVVQDGFKLSANRDGNVYFVEMTSLQTQDSTKSIKIYYHGKPRVAARPPWDGGLIWAKDKKGRPWISIACQGLGASVWYPCKDHQADEPNGVSFRIRVPDATAGTDGPLVCVANGKLLKNETIQAASGVPVVTYDWVVNSPINNYNVIPYIGHYVHYDETYKGEKGPLATSFWTLDYNSGTQEHLRNSVEHTLKNLEFWFGPYPFYEDGYKIVDAPHLGMEHQSAIAYGNGYQNGYLGHDLSQSGWGLKWDFIVVHESAHEWFGNNITTKDLADMWVHESFANYAETLFTTSEFGKEAGNDYVIGTRKNIQNDIPIIGRYNVNDEGSGDMYYKGGNMIHMIRQVINDDEKFRQILRGLNKDFYHQTVTTADIENYISKKSGIDFSKLFDQYLRTTQIPVFSYSVVKQQNSYYLEYAWSNCVADFDLPVKVSLANGEVLWLKPHTKSQLIKIKNPALPEKIVDRNFYVTEKKGG